MKYADAKKKLSKVSKFDTTEIFYDKKKQTFYCYIDQKLHQKAKNVLPGDEVTLFHYVESTRSPAEQEEIKNKRNR